MAYLEELLLGVATREDLKGLLMCWPHSWQSILKVRIGGMWRWSGALSSASLYCLDEQADVFGLNSPGCIRPCLVVTSRHHLTLALCIAANNVCLTGLPFLVFRFKNFKSLKSIIFIVSFLISNSIRQTMKPLRCRVRVGENNRTINFMKLYFPQKVLKSREHDMTHPPPCMVLFCFVLFYSWR